MSSIYPCSGYTCDPKVQGLKNRRSGCIIYSLNLEKNEYRLLFGIDTVSKDLTDFGGSYEPRDGNCVSTAYRELYEESSGVLDIRDRADINNPCIWNDNNLIIFVEVDDVHSFAKKFAINNSQDQNFREMCGVEIISITVLKHCLLNKEDSCMKIFSKPAELLLSTVDIWSDRTFFENRIVH